MTHHEPKNNSRNLEDKKLNQLSSNSELPNQNIIPLLEERLIVNFARQKTGEVVVRKEIKTHTVNINVPVRSERLIIEQVDPVYKQIAIIELGQINPLNEINSSKDHIENLELVDIEENRISTQNDYSLQIIVKGEINSIEDAHQFLNSTFSQIYDDLQGTKIELTLRKSGTKEI